MPLNSRERFTAFQQLVWFWFTLTALISPAFSRRRQLFSANKGQRSEIHCNQTADKVSISLVNIVQVKKNTIWCFCFLQSLWMNLKCTDEKQTVFLCSWKAGSSILYCTHSNVLLSKSSSGCGRGNSFCLNWGFLIFIVSEQSDSEFNEPWSF